jgi:hypothetical protein
MPRRAYDGERGPICAVWPNAVVPLFVSVEGVAEDGEDEVEARLGLFALGELWLGEDIGLGQEWSVEHIVRNLVRDPKLEPLPEDEEVLTYVLIMLVINFH